MPAVALIRLYIFQEAHLDLNELDVPEWAELALDKVEWRKLLQRIAL
jgi:hypothetical protein